MNASVLDAIGRDGALPERHTVSIAIIYDHPSALNAVAATCAALERRLDGQMTFQCEFWSTSQLTNPPQAERAAKQTAEAAMVFLALSEKTALTSSLIKWLDRWLSKLPADPVCALVALIAEGIDDRETGIGHYLARVAREHGLSFFINEFQVPGRKPSATTSALHSVAAARSAFPEIADYESPPRWGLNE